MDWQAGPTPGGRVVIDDARLDEHRFDLRQFRAARLLADVTGAVVHRHMISGGRVSLAVTVIDGADMDDGITADAWLAMPFPRPVHRGAIDMAGGQAARVEHHVGDIHCLD